LQQIVSHIPDSILSAEKKKILLQALEDNEPEYSLRLNPQKFDLPLSLPKVPWCDNAYYIEGKPRFSMDPLWHAGAYYVQEAGSMFLAQILEHLPFEESPAYALDLCAAPGGKTTLMATTLPGNCVVVANEITPQRLKGLHENVIKWGNTNVICSHNAPKDFEYLPDFFDLVLVDAPCSGEGLLRRHDEALNQWSVKLVEECAYRQEQILASALECLKPGGFLIYSTCTYNTRENEDNLEWLIREKGCLPVNLNMVLPAGITVTETAGNKAYRFFPGITRSEGFFITVVQKPATRGKVKHWSDKTIKLKYVPNPVKERVGFTRESTLVEEKGLLKFYAADVLRKLYHLDERLKLQDAGRDFGSVKNGKFIPAETLGFVSGLVIDAEKKLDLEYETAVQFLARNAFALATEKRGYVFMQYEGVLVGLANVLDNRLNNCYPQHWRILKPEMDRQFTLKNFSGV
jgi:16S rRNA C967 or C1407 C5-methylase (RsmB/RsmF family)/NOL1/NOP2/fmu family ribosome biogenesis protein